MPRPPEIRKVIICTARRPSGRPGRLTMRSGLQVLALALFSAALAGCATTLYGNQSGSGTTVTSSRVVASTSGSNASVSLVYGARVPPTAPGGHLSVSSSSSGVLAGAVLFGFLASYIVGEQGPKPLPPGTKILHTCSCYGYQPPVNSESVNRKSTEPVRQNGAEPTSF